MDEKRIISYVGFAIKSGKALFGLESIRRYSGKIYAIIADLELGGDASKRILTVAERKSAAIVRIDGLGEKLNRRGSVKLVAVTDASLGGAIAKETLNALGGQNE